MPFNEGVAYAREDEKSVLGSRDRIVAFQDILVIRIDDIALITNTPAVWDRLKEQAVFDFRGRCRHAL